MFKADLEISEKEEKRKRGEEKEGEDEGERRGSRSSRRHKKSQHSDITGLPWKLSELTTLKRKQC